LSRHHTSRTRNRRGPPVLALLLVALLAAVGGSAAASTTIVPDEFPTVQAAIDAGVDTVALRSGDYAEVPQAYRGVTLLGVGDRRPRLKGLAITNALASQSGVWNVSGIDFVDSVTVKTTNWQARYNSISFDHCSLPEGLQHDILAATDPYDIYPLSVANCRLGGVTVAMAAFVNMVSDTIAGGVNFESAEAVNIQSCWFTGGSGAAFSLDPNQEPTGLIEGNVVEGYDTGISVANSYGLTIRNNVVRDMTDFGIGVHGSRGTISGNRVTACQNGIQCSIEDIVLNDNVVLRSRGFGVLLYSPTDVQAANNVIGRCGDAGLFIESGGNGTMYSRITLCLRTLARGYWSGMVRTID
jgi:parallel beta-helix repeat protein